MSNHYHLVLTDTQGRLPEFLRLLNSLVARTLNFRYRRKEAFWKPGSYSAVQLCSEGAVLDKMVYTLANPVVAGLVGRAWRWEGSSSVGMEFGAVRRVLRPGFLKGGEDVEALRLVAPPLEISTAVEIGEEVRRRLHARENEVRGQFEAEGRRFMGMQAVLAQSWQSSPRSEEAFGTMVPRFATRDRGELRRAIREWKEWVAAYRRALEAFRDGIRDAVFPAGTYLMKVRFEVVVATS